MQRVYYWDGILDPQALGNDYENTLQKLIHGEYRAVNLEKLRGHNVYSARINHTHRLLFNTVNINGKSYLMILDVVLNHDYHKSPVLKPAILKKYLQLNGHLLKPEEMTEAAFETADELDAELPEETEFKYESAECYQQKFIELSVDQNAIVKSLKLPMFVTGAAGSGKSCVAMSMLSHYAAKHLENLRHPILYVTESENLCTNMKRHWQELPLSGKDIDGKVQFKTYAQLINEISPQKKIVGKSEFISFITQRIDHQKQQDKAARKISLRPTFFDNKETLYQEMRIISGCTSWEDYQNISLRQALISDAQERKWLFAAYQDYIALLTDQNCIDLALYQAEIAGTFQLIVVDETQDLSPAQIIMLKKLAINEQICFCEDARQSLTDIKSKETFIGQLLDAKNDNLTLRELRQSYRCPAAAVKMATVMSNLGATLTSQKAESAVETVNEHPGEVTWLNHLDDATLQSLRSQADTPDFAIITAKQSKETAKELFGTKLVFTVDEIKGLEYKKILIYRLMDEEIYCELSAQLQKSVKGAGNEKFGPACNALYTACTRCTESLVIVQDNQKTAHKLRHLITHCQEHGLPKTVLSKPDKSSAVISTQRKQELWFEEVKAQLNKGNINLAKEIYLHKLGKTPEEFNQLITVDYPVETIAPNSAPTSKPKKKKKKKKSTATPTEPTTVPSGLSSPVKLLTSKTTPEETYDLLKSGNNIVDLTKLFQRDDLDVVLFKEMPIHNNECLFTLLCDIKGYQHYLLGALFIEKLDKIAPAFTDAALVGKDTMDRLLHFKMPPIYWMARNESTMIAITQQKTTHMMNAIRQALVNHPYTLEQPIQTGNATTNTNTLFWLASHEAGNVVLQDVIESSPKICASLHASFLTQPYQVGQFLTSVFDHLYLSDIGTYILTKMVSANHALAEAFTVDLLADLNIAQADGSLIPPKSLMTPSRLGLYEILYQINPQKFAGITEAILIKYNEKIKKPITTPQNKTMEYIQGLLRNPSAENLEVLIKHKNSARYLFHTQLVSDEKESVNGECLFTILFDIPASRLILLNSLYAKYELEICAGITGSAVCRVNTNVTEMPPIFWLAGYEDYALAIIRLFENVKEFRSTFNISALTKQLSTQTYLMELVKSRQCTTLFGEKYRMKLSAFQSISAMYLLLLNTTSYHSFIGIMDANMASCISAEMLTVGSVELQATKEIISLLDLIVSRDGGAALVASILCHNDKLRRSCTADLLKGSGLSNGDFVGSCLVYELPKTLMGCQLLVKLISVDQYEPVAMLAFNGFRKGLPDNAQSIKYLIDICKSEDLICALARYLFQNTGITSLLDPHFFEDRCRYPAQSNKGILVATLRNSKSGKEFIIDVKKAINIFCNEEYMSDAEASRVGNQHRLMPQPLASASIKKPNRAKKNSASKK